MVKVCSDEKKSVFLQQKCCDFVWHYSVGNIRIMAIGDFEKFLTPEYEEKFVAPVRAQVDEMLQRASHPDFIHLNQLAQEAAAQGRIPKIIHFCYVNWQHLDALYYPIAKTWLDHLDGYTFVNWTPAILKSIPYARQALRDHMWAYYADYARCYAVYHYGGLYLDMDAVVYRSFDDLLDLPYLLDTEYNYRGDYVPEAAVFGARPKQDFVKLALRYYRSHISGFPIVYEHNAPRVFLKAISKGGYNYLPGIDSIEAYRQAVLQPKTVAALDGTFFSKTNSDLPNRFLEGKWRNITHHTLAPHAYASHQFYSAYADIYMDKCDHPLLRLRRKAVKIRIKLRRMLGA